MIVYSNITITQKIEIQYQNIFLQYYPSNTKNKITKIQQNLEL